MACVNSIVSRRGLQLQILIEPITFVATDFVSELQKSLYYLPLYLGGLVAFSFAPPVYAIAYPLVLAWLILSAWGVALLLAVVYVFLRDIRNGAQVLFRLLLYACPVIYPLSFVPEAYMDFYLLNPFAVMMAVVDSVLLGLPLPGVGYIVAAFFETMFLVWLAHWLYERHWRSFTKVL